MRQYGPRTSIAVLLCSTILVLTAGTTFSAGQTAAQVEQEVQRMLRDESDLRMIDVSVAGTEVTLTGRVPTFWAKSQAIKKTLEVTGVETVASELEIPAVEDDRALIRPVIEAVVNYPYYTVWDFIGGGVTRGVVTLTGSVTPDRDKTGQLFERVAKIPGVQDVRNTIEIQSVSGSDANIRSRLADRIFNSTEFREYASRRNPPFHLLVVNGNVRLVGMVRSAVEKRVLETIVRHTPGVFRVVNDLQTNQ